LGVAQVMDYLPSKQNVLSSIPIIVKKNFFNVSIQIVILYYFLSLVSKRTHIVLNA
jgi:hypothetical protein